MKTGVIRYQKRPDMFGNREWDAGEERVLTPFKLLPFFPVRVRFGVVVVDGDLVEVLPRVRIVREHVDRSHFPIMRTGLVWMEAGGMASRLVGKLSGRINAISLLGRQ
jgi:hypothetical protein